DTQLTATASTLQYNGQTVNVYVWEGLYPGPTLKVKPSDRLRILVNNQLPPTPSPAAVEIAMPPRESNKFPSTGHHRDATVSQPNVTNIHTHGLHVPLV